MRKKVSAFLSLLMLISLTACGDEVKSTESRNEVRDTQVASTVSETKKSDTEVDIVKLPKTEKQTAESTTETENDLPPELIKYFPDGKLADYYCYIEIEYDPYTELYGSFEEGVDLIHTSMGNGQYNDVSVGDNDYKTVSGDTVRYVNIISPVYYEGSNNLSNSFSFTDVYKTLTKEEKQRFISDTIKIFKALVDTELVSYSALQDYEDYIDEFNDLYADKELTKNDIMSSVKAGGMTPTILSFDEYMLQDILHNGSYDRYDTNRTLCLYKLIYKVDDNEVPFVELYKNVYKIDNKDQQGVIDFIKDIYLVSTMRLEQAGYEDDIIFEYLENYLKQYLENDDLVEKIINEINIKGLDDRRKVLQEVVR